MSFNSIVDPILGKAAKSMNAQNQAIEASLQDRSAMQDFQKLEEGIVSDPSKDIMTPVFKNKKTGGQKAQEAEALAQVFNARKQDILARRSTPGVTQTRMM